METVTISIEKYDILMEAANAIMILTAYCDEKDRLDIEVGKLTKTVIGALR